MNDVLFAFLLTLFAGLTTGIGGIIGLFARRNNRKFLSVCLSFSAGVMIYISFVEIFNKANDSLGYRYGDDNGFLFTTIAFFVGIASIALIDKLIPHNDEKAANNLEHDNDRKGLNRTGLMTAVAIAIHNFPEGMVTFMAAMYDPALGVAVAIAIALHNIPEGIAVSAPIYYATGNKKKALLLSFGSGLTEPLGALFAYILLSNLFHEGLFGFIFAAVGGIMVFISVHNLLPVAHEYGDNHQVMKGLFAGMVIMALSLIFI